MLKFPQKTILFTKNLKPRSQTLKVTLVFCIGPKRKCCSLSWTIICLHRDPLCNYPVINNSWSVFAQSLYLVIVGKYITGHMGHSTLPCSLPALPTLVLTRLIYYDVTAIKVILFILVILILTYFFVIWGWGSKLFYFWLDCHLQ